MLRAPATEPHVLAVAIADPRGTEKALALLRTLPVDPRRILVLLLSPEVDRSTLVSEVLPSTDLFEDAHRLTPGTVLVANAADQPRIEKGSVLRGPPTSRPLDRFFRTLADEAAHRAAGVLFGSVASDGVLGLRALKQAGGLTVASWTAPGLPTEVERAFAEVMVDSDHVDDAPLANFDRLGQPLPPFGVLRRHFAGVLGRELARYAPPWFELQIRRGMARTRNSDLEGYRATLEASAIERTRLATDLASRVSRFFSPPADFATLRSILEALESPARARCWVPSCGTGEDAYALAIAAHSLEHRRPSISVFATDVPGPALALARHGLYVPGIEVDLGEAPTSTFFSRDGDLLRVMPELRASVMLAEHDVLTDHAFSRIDVVLCPNLLVRLSPEARRVVLRRFAFALREGGHLVVDPVDVDEIVGEFFEATPYGAGILVRRARSVAPRPGRAKPSLEVALSESSQSFTEDVPEGEEGKDLLRRALYANRIIGEQLRSAQEELAIADEQLRMCAEELESARREAQSRNEELAMVNARFLGKIKALSRANDDLSNLLASTKAAAVFVDRTTSITRVTPAAKELFDDAPVERGASLEGLASALGASWLESEVRTALERGFPVEHELEWPDGRTVLFRVAPYVTEEGELDGGVLTFTDVTELRLADEKLRAQSALAQLGEMAAVISHEVRNALAGIGSAAQIIGGRLPTDAPERAAIDEIRHRIETLDRTVTDLLRFARPLTPMLVCQSVKSILESVRATLAADPNAFDVTFHIDGDDPVVHADPCLLHVAFLNLALNAVHAMEGRGTIRAVSRLVDRECHVDIIDDGPGIPPELRTRIFEPFFSTKPRGTGLGLAIVKRVAEAHGGRITLTDGGDGGTCIGVVLPVARRDISPDPEGSTARIG